MKNKRCLKLLPAFCLMIWALLCLNLCIAADTQHSFVKCTEYSKQNIRRQEYAEINEYPIHANAVTSYLSYDTVDNRLVRFQADLDENGYLIETYTTDYELVDRFVLSKNSAFPIYGGYYWGEKYQFILQGRITSDETAVYPLNGNEEGITSEAIMVLEKYDREWNKIDELVISDIYTYEPFCNGTVRFCEIGEQLFIRTTHSFKLCPSEHDAGIRHQANMMLQVDIEQMNLTAISSNISNIGTGYVSHSFNQFVENDNNLLVALDQGDCYPRALTFFKYTGDVTVDAFTAPNVLCEHVNIVNFDEYEDYNYTRMSVGGLVPLNDYYAIPYSQYLEDTGEYEITLSLLDKLSDEVTFVSVAKTGKQTTPHIVKCSDEQVVIIWQDGTNVCYCFVNTAKNKPKDILEINNGCISDCQPIMVGEKIIWYAFKNNKIWFYEISTADALEFQTIEIDNNHKYVPDYSVPIEDDYYEVVCQFCFDRKKLKMTVDMKLSWSLKEDGEYSASLPAQEFKVGTQLFFKTLYDGDYEKSEPVVIVPPELIVTMNENDELCGAIKFTKSGSYQFTVQDRYNPFLTETVELKVVGNVYGDVNNNGEVDARDYILIKRAYFGTFKLTEEQLRLADINKNGKLDVRDYILCKRIYFGTFRLPPE